MRRFSLRELSIVPCLLAAGMALAGTLDLRYGRGEIRSLAVNGTELLRSFTLEEGGIVADGVATQAGNAEMMVIIQQAIGDLQRGDSEAAARAFTDQVIGPGAYERATPAERQLSLDNVKTLLSGRPPHPLACDVMRRITVPTLFVTARTPRRAAAAR